MSTSARRLTRNLGRAGRPRRARGRRAADPAAVIESTVVRPEWRASAYTYLSRALIAALDPTT